MKINRTQLPLAAALACALAFTTAQAQQVPLPKTPADVPGPAAGTLMTKEYVQMVGRMAWRRNNFKWADTITATEPNIYITASGGDGQPGQALAQP